MKSHGGLFIHQKNAEKAANNVHIKVLQTVSIRSPNDSVFTMY